MLLSQSEKNAFKSPSFSWVDTSFPVASGHRSPLRPPESPWESFGYLETVIISPLSHFFLKLNCPGFTDSLRRQSFLAVSPSCSAAINTLLTRDILICLLVSKCYWTECLNIQLHNKSLAMGVSFHKNLLVNNLLRTKRNIENLQIFGKQNNTLMNNPSVKEEVLGEW